MITPWYYVGSSREPPTAAYDGGLTTPQIHTPQLNYSILLTKVN